VSKTPLLELKAVSKNLSSNGRETLAVDALSLSLKRGEIFGLIGGSGAGKSTITRLVLGLISPSSGELLFEGKPLNTQARVHISPVFQDFNLLESKTVLENIAFPLVLRGKTDALQKARKLIEMVGLEDKVENYPAQLSGGQKQRVAIARALTTDPKLLLCDEPTSSLDPENTAAILELLEQVNKKMGLTILLISHEMEVVKNLCHRVGVLEKGKLIEEGDIETLIAHPHNKVTLSYFEPYSTRSFKKYFSQHPERVWRLCFFGEVASRPLITELVTKHSVQINILMGGIDFVRDRLVGTLVVEISGADEEKARSWLKSQGVEIEEVKNASI
jgi:D-methionine transport system ATP-binding protein